MKVYLSQLAWLLLAVAVAVGGLVAVGGVVAYKQHPPEDSGHLILNRINNLWKQTYFLL